MTVFLLSCLCRVARAAAVLLSDPCFQLHSIQHLLGESELLSSFRAAPPSAEHKHFSLHTYTDYISPEEQQKVERMLSFLTNESKEAAASAAPTSEEDLCPICYAHPISAVFKPCSHKSCKACINQHLMNNKECFFCKATITGVDDYSKPPAS
ncbi:E3 ubiquitin-protein ligase RNF123-like [Huso huso]|uniref:E3 ubiquitin-protein ligase RNF123-like n=1 Tax=Huso huso TaxID=61971 RepID=A0ABR0Z6T0_HUSHU